MRREPERSYHGPRIRVAPRGGAAAVVRVHRGSDMQDVDQLPPVKQGLWFFAGVTTCHVHIVRHHTLYGTGDADDPPELARDREVECYYIRFDKPHTPAPWQDGGAALSLREAVFLAERRLGPVVCWAD